MADEEFIAGGRRLRLTSLDKVLYPATGFTKRDLVAYYTAVADVLLPHITGRPLTLGRWPSGVDARGFAQMECRGAPEWMRTRPLELLSGEVRNYCVVDDLASLVWVANLGTLELHPYYSAPGDEEHALIAIFDLDPVGGAGIAPAADAALELRALLGTRGLDAWPKTSGGDGVHVFVPLNTPHPFAQVRAFCEAVAAQLDAPHVHVDCAQNHPRRSLAAPYSLRAADAPAVSTPLEWSELEHPSQLAFGPADVLQRIAARGDLFAPVLERRQSLDG